MIDWAADILKSDKPLYLAIADAIEAGLAAGTLAAGDRLPPQRKLASRLGVDFTTVARGYSEAARRGVLDSTVGRGSFVRSRARSGSKTSLRAAPVDLTMNLPPDPDDPALIARMQAGLEEVARDLVPLLHYQSFGGSPQAKDAASSWLGRRGLVPSQERLFICPGAHPALSGIFSLLIQPGDTVLCESITYPGVRAIAAQHKAQLYGLAMDEHGILPEALADLCSRARPKALYLNPTLQNPTTLTLPAHRREALTEIVRRHRLPIIEDDAYGFIPAHAPPPFAALAPELTWHIAGLAKCFGAGLRIAYVIAPDAKAGWNFAALMRANIVMASPITAALATRWIEDGTGDSILRFIRTETAARQKLAAELLPPGLCQTDPLSFNLWMNLPGGWSRAAFAGQMRAVGIGVVTSDAFSVSSNPPEAARICLGGPTSRAELQSALTFMAHSLSNSPAATSDIF
nr:PLP-dependent aminotransferase family protein [uncultured Acidocella sp.]